MLRLPRPYIKLCLFLIAFVFSIILFWYLQNNVRMKIRGALLLDGVRHAANGDAINVGIRRETLRKAMPDEINTQNPAENTANPTKLSTIYKGSSIALKGRKTRKKGRKTKKNQNGQHKWHIRKVTKHASRKPHFPIVTNTIQTQSDKDASQVQIGTNSRNIIATSVTIKTDSSTKQISTVSKSTTWTMPTSYLIKSHMKSSTVPFPLTPVQAPSPSPKQVLPTTSVYGDSTCSANPWRPYLLELFTEWVRIAKENNIEYVLYAGTQLGQLRNQDIIPYDSDIDLLMDVKYFGKMQDIAVTRGFDNFDGKVRFVVQPEFHLDIPSTSRKRYSCTGKVTPHMIDQCSFQEPLGRLIKGRYHIDFYHFYNRGKTLDDPSEEHNKVYQKSDFYPLQHCRFMGKEATCPHKPWQLLKVYFNSDKFMEPTYKCKAGQWLNKDGNSPF